MSGLDNLKISEDKKKYITEQLNPLLELMVTECLTTMPDSPIPFMLAWLKARKAKAEEDKLSPEERDRIVKENEKLKADLANMESKVQEAAQMVSGGAAAEEEEEEEEDDELDESFFQERPAEKGGPRASVSAEAYGQWNVKKAFTPPNYPKSDDQKARLAKVLGGSFLFQSLEAKDMQLVVGAMQEKILEPKTRTINQGENGDFLYVIETGCLDCYIKPKEGGDEIKVKTVEAGDAFGELALLYNCPRAASVESRDKCTLWQLDRETFNAIVKEAAQAKREKNENFLKTVSLLSGMGAYELSQVADALVEKTLKDGEAIVKEGEEGNQFFLIAEGEATAQKNGADVAAYKAGDYFGELALLKNQPRAATVMAKGAAKVLSLDRKSFNRLLGPVDQVMANAASKYK